MKLYEITNEYKQLSEELIENGGELTPELELQYNSINDNLETKARNIAFMVLQAEDELLILEKHIKRLEALKKSRENGVKSIKNYVLNCMQIAGISEIKLETLKISLRPSKSVEIVDVLTLPEEAFQIVPEYKSPSKTLIKKMIDDGKEVNGARIVTNYSVQIK